MQFFNTLTRKKEPFVPLHASKVGVYACGPTVYWFAHIGNMRAYIFSDLLSRTLSYNGFDVTLVMNITDVGHLTGDTDDGEDKMIVAMKREGKTAYQIAEFYTDAFFADLARLNIQPASVYPRATQHIAEQISMIQSLEKNGFTYRTSDGIYFDTSKLADYGRLSGQKLEDKKAGARVELGEKKNGTDFALWKFAHAGAAKRDMEWESPWGVGFPGWHIECSAMSKKYLGVPFDIHTGGIDHIPVHHENELAQTEGADGVLEANVWMHSEFLTVDGGRMGKSLGNIYTISELSEKGFDPIAYRFFVLGAHYRTKLNFTFEALGAAQNALVKLRETVRGWDAPTKINAEYHTRFAAAMADDLNTSQALAILWDLVGDTPLSSAERSATILDFDRVLGLGLIDYVAKPLEISADVQALVSERESARKEKRWADSDRLRDAIAAKGYAVEDTASGAVVRKNA